MIAPRFSPTYGAKIEIEPAETAKPHYHTHALSINCKRKTFSQSFSGVLYLMCLSGSNVRERTLLMQPGPVRRPHGGMTMKRKVTVWIITALVLTFCCLAQKQTAHTMPRIGFISSSGTPAVSSPQLKAFILGLRELGYVEGKNILIERLYAEGRLDRMAPFVQEFVEQKVDVIIGVNNVVIQAAKEATKTIPIVMISSVNPVAAGYVASFARPGGNITGLAGLSRELSAKRVEILKELLPKMSRAGILWDAHGPGPAVALQEYEKAAAAFKLDFHSFELRGPNPDFAGAFRAAKKHGVDALIVVGNPLLAHNAKKVFEIAKSNRMPSMTEERRYVEAGGLISYGASLADLYRRAAVFVDKILKGAQPAHLSVQQPTNFELVINSTTAKRIGLAIPRNVLARVDELIR
jgi:putative ABC transport system substrate-binding protein